MWVWNHEGTSKDCEYGTMGPYGSRTNHNFVVEKNVHLGYGDPLIGFCPYFLQDQKSEGSPSFFSLPTFSPTLTATTVFSTIFLSHAQHIYKTSKHQITKTRKKKSGCIFSFC